MHKNIIILQILITYIHDKCIHYMTVSVELWPRGELVKLAHICFVAVRSVPRPLWKLGEMNSKLVLEPTIQYQLSSCNYIHHYNCNAVSVHELGGGRREYDKCTHQILRPTSPIQEDDQQLYIGVLTKEAIVRNLNTSEDISNIYMAMLFIYCMHSQFACVN